jgi:Zn ribbon nucleic-acid-binding protein
MAFNISDRLIDTYQEGIDAIIEQLGKSVIIVKNPVVTDCPNCGYDKRRNRSNGTYNTNNPNPIGQLNKEFVNGQVCPVCSGRGQINSSDQHLEIKATLKWNPYEMMTLEKDDVVIITVSNNSKKEEVYSILTNTKTQLKEKGMNNLVIITTPNVRLSKLTNNELDQIGLKRK